MLTSSRVLQLRAALSLALGLALGGASCVTVTPPGTAFASEPPGARVHVDGQDTGWVTPCQIALDLDRSHVVTVALAGYVPREIRLEASRRTRVVDWDQAVVGMGSSTHFPILMPIGDFLFPVREDWNLAPGRVFVRLRPESGP